MDKYENKYMWSTYYNDIVFVLRESIDSEDYVIILTPKSDRQHHAKELLIELNYVYDKIKEHLKEE